MEVEVPQGWYIDEVDFRIKINFIKSGILQGEWYTEVPVGIKNIDSVFDLAKGLPRIDLVCVESEKNILHPYKGVREYLHELDFSQKEVWLIEVKRKINYDAIGQILGYRELFKEDWGSEVKGIGIAFEELEHPHGQMLRICKKLGIFTWRVPFEDWMQDEIDRLRLEIGIDDTDLRLIDLQLLKIIHENKTMKITELINHFTERFSRGQLSYSLSKLSEKRLIKIKSGRVYLQEF